ncbi:ArsR/SmtB family transcription factor [Actinoplanes sp. RD1]|uniref:ArsR/SmtB family transcription factor n=1 Tax=Actinoplanes sp. RD1 TaxID=3064538 RepID=UPI00274169DE|nr:metalloregulator ArsR/SmtB family transcription factor [Actinoplanes sp. RD1]
MLTGGPAPTDRPVSQCGDPSEHQDRVISASPDLIRLLADPLRARIVQILTAGPATTSHLVADTGAKQPNVSGHLKLLRESGVVVTEPRGRFTYYRLVPGALQSAAMHLVDLASDARSNADNYRGH